MNIRKLTWSKLIRFARHYYSLYIVRTLWVHWFNPLYTLYFNLIFSLLSRLFVSLFLFTDGLDSLRKQDILGALVNVIREWLD